MGKLLDLAGKTFNRLTVIRRHPVNYGKGQSRWVCRCECGKEYVGVGHQIASGHTKSCGCLQPQVNAARSTKHGNSTRTVITREYKSWLSMKSRCNHKGNIKYSNYGGRGITVCDEWLNDFQKFFDDMDVCPKGFTLDRIDNDLGYFKDNCRWASYKTQGRNTRSAKLSVEKAEAIRQDTRTHKAIAKDYGVTEPTIWSVKNGRTWKKGGDVD